jgi:hypothetical protein
LRYASRRHAAPPSGPDVRSAIGGTRKLARRSLRRAPRFKPTASMLRRLEDPGLLARHRRAMKAEGIGYEKPLRSIGSGGASRSCGILFR